jgi:dUTP pyrophosphatase
MRYLSGEDVVKILDGVVHEETQRHDFETDLTVGAIFQITGPGAVDFGGSEFEPAPRAEIAPEKESPGDDYGWWTLDPGTYIVRYNEVPALSANYIAYVQPHERLFDAGAHHPTFYFRDRRPRVEALVTVGAGGLRIKENARISKLLILDLVAG